jgi:hypothetical protein
MPSTTRPATIAGLGDTQANGDTHGYHDSGTDQAREDGNGKGDAYRGGSVRQ